jgi:predicted homoserine dehydrogenase-like protein
MKPLKKRLLSLKEDIHVAVIGCGRKGKGLVYQLYATPGMRPVVIADHRIEKAVACAQWLNRDYEIVRSLDGLNRAIERGRLAITDNGELAAASELINVLVECTDAVAEGGIHAMKAIQHHQHVVMLNSMADLMYGPLLLQLANEEGVVYTTCDGTPAAALKKLIDDIDLWGLELALAGVLVPDSDGDLPTLKVVRETDKSQHNGFHHTPLQGATDLKIGMAILANGIHGRAALSPATPLRDLDDAVTLYDLPQQWKNKTPLVDCIASTDATKGLVAIAYTDLKFQQEILKQQGLGNGPFFAFHRPFLVGHIEAVECIMEAYFNGTARLHPYHGLKTNVFAYAKKDLKRGEVIDGVDGEKTFGMLQNLGDNTHYAGLPVCIAEGLKLRADVHKNSPITLDDVFYDSDQLSFSLYFRALQANTQKTILKRSKVVEENLPYIIPM